MIEAIDSPRKYLTVIVYIMELHDVFGQTRWSSLAFVAFVLFLFVFIICFFTFCHLSAVPMLRGRIRFNYQQN